VGFPDFGSVYIPAPAGVKELNIGDAWRAVWVDSDELPPDAPIIHAYAVVCFEDRGYITREAGTETWNTVEGVVTGGETPAQWLKRAAMEQVGATLGYTELLGYFICRATSHNPDFPAGTTTVRPVYVASAKRMKDLGKGAAWERRRLPLNEFARALRGRYPEIIDQVVKAVDRYVVLRQRGEAA
jgi:hypothetical protein